MVKQVKQLFFQADHLKEALDAADIHEEPLYEVYDRRSKNPSPRMYILTRMALDQAKRAPFWKRMWVTREV